MLMKEHVETVVSNSQPNKVKPLQSLLTLSKDKNSDNFWHLLNQIEEGCPSLKGNTKRLALFFYIIEILRSNDITFYVKGGITLQYYLKEHARVTNDIDLLIPSNSLEFYEKAQEALNNNKYGLDIELSDFRKEEADKDYYYDTFFMMVKVSYRGELIDIFSLEGTCEQFFNDIEPVIYPGPSFIKEDFTFLGVPLEFTLADKILAITSEQVRPYRHLIDTYSIINIADIDIDLVKKYLSILLKKENKIRDKYGIDHSNYIFEINKDKKFAKNFAYPRMQAGYKETFLEMVNVINKWMKKNL